MVDQESQNLTSNGARSMIYGERNPDQIAAPISSNKMRDIHITGLSHGFLVTVGCQNFAIEKADDLIAKLAGYIHRPAETEQKWNDGKLF